MTNPSGSQPPLAIVGLSALFPQADSIDQFWSNIRRGVDAITEVPATHWSPDEYFHPDQKSPDRTYARRGGFLSPVPFDPLEFGISPNNLEAIDTSQLLGLVGAKRALEHAGYGAGRSFDRSRVGCILGVTGTLELVIPLGARLGHPRWRKALRDAGVPDDIADDVVQRISDSYVPWQENSFPGLLGNVVAGRIANRLDLHGTNCVVDAACASSLSAIHLAALELWTGRSDMVVTGGIDTFNDIFMFMCFSKTPALSPSGDAKPFSETADGTILGEGVGILVLKRLEDAQRDGDQIHAILKGIGTSSDGAGNAVYAPKAEGQIRCLQDAYRVAGVQPDTIELVEAHGTGTKVGDATEVSGLLQVYQSSSRPRPWCAIGSIKSQIGHTKAAAGVAGVLKAILALKHRVLPPTIKVNRPPAGLLAADSPFYVNPESRPWLKPTGHPRRAAVSAFGFGGSNFHCVLEESPVPVADVDWDGDIQIVALSASGSAELGAALEAWAAPWDWESVRRKAYQTRASFQSGASHRLVFVVERNRTDLARLVAGAQTMLQKYPDRATWSTPEGAHFGRGRVPGRLGVLFPGQGSQYAGMCRELACRFPVVSDILADANDVFEARRDDRRESRRLTDFIYPFPAWTDADRDRADADLRATQIAQPAIGAISLAALAVLEQFGVQPEAAAGHSYGELTALCAGRRFAPRTLYRLSMLRGRLMAEAQQTEGGMLAVGASLSQVENAIREMAVDLVVANHNSPSQVVLSGRIPEIERATQLFSQRNLRGKQLPVAAAFHSPLVATASRAFRPELDDVEFAASNMPVYANSTGTEYPSDPQAARDLLASQLARPVNFVHEIEQMYADGIRTFVEAGPGSVLTGLVNSILSGREFRAIALDSSNGRRGGMFDLAQTLAQLAASGYSLRLTAWEPQPVPEPAGNRLRVPICGANYVKPKTVRPPRPVADFLPQPAEVEPVSVPVATRAASNVCEPEQAATIVASRPVPVEEIATLGNNSPVPPPLRTNELATLQEQLATLQKMQEETARLHQQFLQSQEAALRIFEDLARRHLDRTRGTSPTAPAAPPAHAVPAVVPFTPVNGSSLMGPGFSAPTAISEQRFAAVTYPAAEVFESVAPPAGVAEAPAATNAVQAAAPAEPTAAPVKPAAPAEPVGYEARGTAPVEPVAPTAAPLASSVLAPVVLAVVSEKTGYPTEMLNLGMSLDHDLGIDSIKRVEILSALQERVPELPAFQPEELGTLQTLQDVLILAESRTAIAPAAVVGPSVRSPVIEPTCSAVTCEPAPCVDAAPASAGLTEAVLAVVAEKTGYPTEMLNPGMSLDHDLGIDSIKRVEILSALQERVPGLPSFQPEELGTLQTLQDVIALASRRIGADPGVPAAAEVSRPAVPDLSPPVTPASPAGSLAPVVLAVVAEKTGYPTEMLNLDMSLDHDLGIDSIKRVEILSALQERVPGLPAFLPEELGTLQTLRDVVGLAESRGIATVATAGAVTGAPTVNPSAAVESPGSMLETVAVEALASTALPVAGATAGPALATVVLDVVAEKTGYPTEMLNLEMSLDHDLGIDSIKRVEILSALQERVPGLPAFQPEELGALQTLADVVRLAEARGGAVATARVTPAAESRTEEMPPPAGSADTRSTENTGRFLMPPESIVRSIVTMERVSAGATVELPIVRGAEVWITEDGLELSLRIAAELSARGFKPRVVNLDDPVAVSFPEKMAGLIVVAPADGIRDRQLGRAIEWLQKSGPALRRTAKLGTCVFATVSRLDGRFGFEGVQSLADPLSGGLAGLTKSVAREWPELTCKAFDLSADWPTATEAAIRIVDELFRGGPVEIGLTPRDRWTPVVREESLAGTAESVPIQPGELVLVSGGARGVTAAAAFAAAHAWRPRLAILGRSPVPQDEPEWLRSLASEADVKKALIERMPRGTLPRAVEAQVREILAAREVRSTLARLQQAGILVSYHPADLRELATVRPLILQLQEQYGPVRGIIHGAGVLADQRIEDKTREQFEKVYQTKVSGLRNVLGAISPDALKFLCLFSSYTARYGRVGQCDYAIANEVLNKLSRQFAVEHPRTRVVSFNWGPWDGGMVTGGLKKVFASEGVGLIPLDAGAEVMVQELSQTTHRPVEVLVLGRDRGPEPEVVPSPPVVAPEPVSAPRDSSNILLGGSSREVGPSAATPPGSSNVLLGNPARATPPSVPPRTLGSSNVLLAGTPEAPKAPPPPPVPGPSGSWVFAEIGTTSSADLSEMKLAFERTLDVRNSPYLESHVIGGKAVLPMAMILEWLAHGAIHHNPGLDLEGVEDFRVFHGVRLDRTEEVPLRVMVGKPARVGGRFEVRAQLVGRMGDRDHVFAGARLVLASQLEAAPEPALQVAPQGYSQDMATAYATRLFHGQHLQGIAAVETCSRDGIIVDSRTSPAPWAWMREPLRSAWIADPLALDAALQAIILWTQEQRGMPCLPSFIGSYRQYRKIFPHTGVKIVVRIVQATEHSIRADVEFLDLQGQVVARITGCESVADASLSVAFQKNRLV